MPSLQHAFARWSPRLTQRPTPLASALIYLALLTLWGLLFAQIFIQTGVFAWAAGIVYVCYDTALLIFVAVQTKVLAGKLQAQSKLALAEQAALDLAPGTALANLPMVSLGVIVAAHNEAKVLPMTLRALLAQAAPPEQIIIADDGSSDETPRVLLENFGIHQPPLGQLSQASPSYPSIFWLRLPHGGKARALNAALLHVTTETLLTVDADTLLDDNALLAVRRAFSTEPELVAATGVLEPICAQTISGRLFQWFQTYEYIRNFISRYAWMRADSLLLISGAFASFRRDAVLQVGGFDPECLVEDYELIHRLHRYSVDHALHWRVRVLGQARARTDAPGSLMSFLRQRRRWFAGFLQTQYWNRDMVGNSRYGKLGTWMLPVKAADTLQPIYGLTAFAFLIYFLLSGQRLLVTWVVVIMVAKILVDLAFHLWSVHLYRRWTASTDAAARAPSYAMAFLATVVEPFSFQLLRHTGATWGWLSLISGQHSWGVQTRGGLLAPVEENQ